jgi:agmatine deiminase
MKYRMPAEWEPHEATWLAWPKNPESFPASILPDVERIYLRMIAVLSIGEKVNVLVDDDVSEERVAGLLDEQGIRRNVILHRVRTADVWMRDYGPIFVKQGKKLKITKWKYNAWGGKYDDLMRDDGVVDALSGGLGFEVIRPGIVLEGGSIDVNGTGMLLTTEQCLLNPNRNPRMTKKQIEGRLSDYLGATHVVWLKEGIAGDDTDGHVDDIARFVDPSTVLCAVEENPADANYEALKLDFELLQKSLDQDGEPLEVVPLPMPGPLNSPMGRLPASYSNFYIGNAAVLLPVFNHKNDVRAQSLLEQYFPGRKVVPLDCRALVYGLGAIHCVSQQQPL